MHSRVIIIIIIIAISLNGATGADRYSSSTTIPPMNRARSRRCRSGENGDSSSSSSFRVDNTATGTSLILNSIRASVPFHPWHHHHKLILHYTVVVGCLDDD